VQLHEDDGKTALAPTEMRVYFAPPWWLTPLYGGSHVALRCCWCGTALVHVKSGGTSEFPMHALEFASLCEATVARVLVARGLYIGCRLCSLDLELSRVNHWSAIWGPGCVGCQQGEPRPQVQLAAPAVRRCALGGVLHVSESDHLGVLEL